jgi:hypothetical protein
MIEGLLLCGVLLLVLSLLLLVAKVCGILRLRWVAVLGLIVVAICCSLGALYIAASASASV